MTKNEALELLRSGKELTEAQRLEIAAVLQNAEVLEDEWESSGGWVSSDHCW